MKTESALHPLPRSFLVKSLTDFAAGLDQELLLCPVRALREYLQRTSAVVNRPHRLFFVSSYSFSCDVQEWYLVFPTRGHS